VGSADGIFPPEEMLRGHHHGFVEKESYFYHAGGSGGQFKTELRAVIDNTVHGNRAAMQIENPLGDGET
jgi:hypothetical protein